MPIRAFSFGRCAVSVGCPDQSVDLGRTLHGTQENDRVPVILVVNNAAIAGRNHADIALLIRLAGRDVDAKAFHLDYHNIGIGGLVHQRLAHPVQRDEAGQSAQMLRNLGATVQLGYAAGQRKRDMACDLLAQVGLTLSVGEDQETLEADIRAMLFALRRVLRHPSIRRVVTDLQAEIARTPVLGQSDRAYIARLARMIAAAIKAGDDSSPAPLN